MVDAQKEDNVFVNGSCTENGVVEAKVDASKVNGCTHGKETSSSGLGGGLLTYRRRRNAKLLENGPVWGGSETQYAEKLMNNSFDQARQKRSHSHATSSTDCSLKDQTNIVLEQICYSLESEGGLKRCIQDALAFHPGTGGRTTVKESVHSCEAGSKCTCQTAPVHGDNQNSVKGSVGVMSTVSVDEPNHDRVTEVCLSAFFDIIVSEKFAELCTLLLENGIKAEKVFDLSYINSRMKEKAYESSPNLFHSDIQQIWRKLQKIGTDITSLAKGLSEKTLTSFREQVGSSANGTSEDGRHEFLAQESGMHKAEPTDSYAIDEAHTCRHCGEPADGRNGLVCDSCEEMYHISCIEPAVEEIPVRSWYCANCTAKGIESPHDNCIACERLNAARSPFDDIGEDEPAYEEPPDELEESSNELVRKEGDRRFSDCKVCGTVVRNDEDYRICGHSFCAHKFYHVKCLTNKQLISYGPCWYCPSCLCRGCFIDRDDDKIVLCDGCDHAYHIYCMKPPRSTIPRGKWFCTKCDAGIQCILRAKHSYENMQNTSRKRPLDRGKLKTEERFNKSGGVDMLLNAAKTLKYEENLMAMGLKAK